MIETGTVTSVATSLIGDYLDADAAVGDQTLLLNDNADFSPGDVVRLQTTSDDPGLTYAVDAVNGTTDLHLSTTVATAVPAGGLVTLYPPRPFRVALVQLASASEPAPARVVPALDEALPDGIRDTDAAETVLVTQTDDGQRFVTDVLGRPEVTVVHHEGDLRVDGSTTTGQLVLSDPDTGDPSTGFNLRIRSDGTVFKVL